MKRRAASFAPSGFRLTGRLLAILAFNAVPLVGVLWFDWSVALVMLLYWAENVVVGVFTLLRMLVSGAVQSGLGGAAAAAFLGAFFVLHYGAFCTGHLIFVVLITMGSDGAAAVQSGSMFADGPRLLFKEAGPWGVAALGAMHAVFFVDWLRRAGFRRDDPRMLMGKAYPRIILLHVTIIFGAGAAVALGQPLWSVAVLVILKTAYDAGAEVLGARRRGSLSPA